MSTTRFWLTEISSLEDDGLPRSERAVNIDGIVESRASNFPQRERFPFSVSRNLRDLDCRPPAKHFAQGTGFPDSLDRFLWFRNSSILEGN